jgi:hypothetical protein
LPENSQRVSVQDHAPFIAPEELLYEGTNSRSDTEPRPADDRVIRALRQMNAELVSSKVEIGRLW